MLTCARREISKNSYFSSNDERRFARGISYRLGEDENLLQNGKQPSSQRRNTDSVSNPDIQNVAPPTTPAQQRRRGEDEAPKPRELVVDDKAGPVDTNAEGLEKRASAVLGVDLDVIIVADAIEPTRCSVSIGGGSTQNPKISIYTATTGRPRQIRGAGCRSCKC